MMILGTQMRNDRKLWTELEVLVSSLGNLLSISKAKEKLNHLVKNWYSQRY
jgi:hypothetical protein